MIPKFLQPLETNSGKPLLADGAMGTLLVARGVAPDANIDELNLTDPERIAQAHRDYPAAGAQLLETNTFGANRFKLAAAGLEDKLEGILRAGVAVARWEAGSGAGAALVAGGVGPLGGRLGAAGGGEP